MPPNKEFNASVLASLSSKLISSIVNPMDFVYYSIDSDLMVRVWCLGTGKCKRSYILETRDHQIAEQNQRIDGSKSGEALQKKKAQLARTDEAFKFLVVAFEEGEIQVNDLYSGQLIYNNCNFDPLKLEFEVANFKFFSTQTKFWFAASCWEGRVAFVSKPQISQGRNFLMFKRCKSSHSRDVISLDINKDNNLVTASVDNVICFWKSFTGVESKSVKIPEEIASTAKGQQVSYVKFPFKNKKDYLLVAINNGDLYILET